MHEVVLFFSSFFLISAHNDMQVEAFLSDQECLCSTFYFIITLSLPILMTDKMLHWLKKKFYVAFISKLKLL